MSEHPKVDKEFAAYLPPLDPDAFAKLEAKLLKEGCRDRLVVWKETGIIIEGHHRLKIAKKHGLTYETVELSFDGRGAVEEWIRDNQLARRNLTDEQRAYYIGKAYKASKLPVGRQINVAEVATLTPPTAETIATEHGVSPRTVRTDAAFADKVDELPPKERDAVLNGVSGLTKAEVIDGKAPVLCDRCKRVGAVKDCPKCEEARAAKPKKNVQPEREPGDDTETERAQETPADVMKRVNSEIESFCRLLMKTAEENIPDDHWLRNDNRREGALRKIKDACETLRSCKCSATCPRCQASGQNGKGKCIPCHGTGRLPKLNLDML